MDLSKTALVIIDVQASSKLIAGLASPISYDEVLSNNALLIKAFAEAEAPIYLVHTHPKILPQKMREKFARSLLEAEVEGLSTVYKVIKFGPSPFKHSDYGLESELKEKEIQKLVITGVSTSNAVVKLAREGTLSGFEIIFVKDATTDMKESAYKKVIEKEALKMGKVLETADFTSHDDKNI